MASRATLGQHLMNSELVSSDSHALLQEAYSAVFPIHAVTAKQKALEEWVKVMQIAQEH